MMISARLDKSVLLGGDGFVRACAIEARSVVFLRALGYTTSEIAVMSGRSVRWVQRLFVRIAKEVAQ